MRGSSDWSYDGPPFKVIIDHEGVERDLAPHFKALAEQARHVFGSYFYHSHLDHSNVVFTGEGPFAVTDMRAFAPKAGAIRVRAMAGDEESVDWGAFHLVVIGRQGFDEDGLITAALEDDDIEFVSQEALVNFVLFGHQPHYYPGDPRLQDHPGLRFLRDLGFRWPSTYAEPSSQSSDEEFEREEKSWLRRDYGYSVAKKVPVRRSRQSLKEAVEAEGLEKVAGFVAWLARSWKRMDTDRFDAAIARWESDLAWLKRTYYDGSRHSFQWPSSGE